jgi:hypothetical protein
MRALIAISVTVGLLAACYVVSALVSFDLTWVRTIDEQGHSLRFDTTIPKSSDGF